MNRQRTPEEVAAIWAYARGRVRDAIWRRDTGAFNFWYRLYSACDRAYRRPWGVT